MVLNIGGGGLFPSQDLPQEYGKINERWNQEGSVVKNIQGDNVQNEVIYSVTAGKTLFIKSILVDDAAAAIVSGALKDDGAAGTVKVDFHINITTTDSFTFEVPLEFSDDIYISSDDVADVTLTGWEE